MDQAIAQRNKLRRSADIARWSLSLVSFLQVFLGAMTTGVSAIRLSGERVRFSKLIEEQEIMAHGVLSLGLRRQCLVRVFHARKRSAI